jgi:hypothetical protein
MQLGALVLVLEWKGPPHARHRLNRPPTSNLAPTQQQYQQCRGRRRGCGLPLMWRRGIGNWLLSLPCNALLVFLVAADLLEHGIRGRVPLYNSPSSA